MTDLSVDLRLPERSVLLQLVHFAVCGATEETVSERGRRRQEVDLGERRKRGDAWVATRGNGQQQSRPKGGSREECALLGRRHADHEVGLSGPEAVAGLMQMSENLIGKASDQLC
ncbi:hypothetical protein MTO96_036619 [Rhipicephalus appendiculatus]